MKMLKRVTVAIHENFLFTLQRKERKVTYDYKNCIIRMKYVTFSERMSSRNPHQSAGSFFRESNDVGSTGTACIRHK